MLRLPNDGPPQGVPLDAYLSDKGGAAAIVLAPSWLTCTAAGS